MNIFVLSTNPVEAAQHQCDKHIVKMIVESAQMLCTAIHNLGKHDVIYKPTHKNHPCTLWVQKSEQNWGWLVEHSLALCEEYTYRYRRQHKSLQVIRWCVDHTPTFTTKNLTPFVQAMPEQYKQQDPVLAYRTYYKAEKIKFAKWNKNRLVPDWWNTGP